MAEKYENSFKKLEEILVKLEKGDLALDESIKAFEEGIKHVALCSKKLEDAESKVQSVIENKELYTKPTTEKFETSFKKLEEILCKLEKDSLNLDESIKIFEEGMKYAIFCSKRLEEAERKVEIIVKQKDLYETKPFTKE